MRVGTLALGVVAATVQGGVVTPRQTLETEALLALQSGIMALTATCHDKTPSGVGRRIVAFREVERLKPGGSRRNADLCDCKS